MPHATISFEYCVQDSQEYGSDDQHMVSRVFFSIEAGGKAYPGLSVDVKQVVGDDFETGPLEVDTPQGYKGPMNYTDFRRAVEEYYRQQVGSRGSGIKLSGGSSARMTNNVIRSNAVGSFEYSDDAATW